MAQLQKESIRRKPPTRRPVPPPREPTRRTEGVRTQGRSARIVEDVLVATAEELGRVGYAALKVEDVAARSGVNKTTIYRRWPTKVELVTGALRGLAEVPEPPDTGSLREDLLQMLRVSCARASSPLKLGIMRAIMFERTHPEVDIVTRKLAAEHLVPRRLVVERGIARGELPQGIDVELFLELAFAPVLRRLTMTHQKVDEAFLQYAVDVLLAGVRSVATSKKR